MAEYRQAELCSFSGSQPAPVIWGEKEGFIKIARRHHHAYAMFCMLNIISG